MRPKSYEFADYNKHRKIGKNKTKKEIIKSTVHKGSNSLFFPWITNEQYEEFIDSDMKTKPRLSGGALNVKQWIFDTGVEVGASYGEATTFICIKFDGIYVHAFPIKVNR